MPDKALKDVAAKYHLSAEQAGEILRLLNSGFNPSTGAAIDAFFGVYVPIGAWLAPALLLIAVVFAPTWLSRKVFTMADAFTKHVSDKDAHKEK